MKRAKSSESLAARRWRPARVVAIVAVLYIVIASVKLLFFFSNEGSSSSSSLYSAHSRLIQYDQTDQTLNVEEDRKVRMAEKDSGVVEETTTRRRPDGYGRITGEILRRYAQARSRSRSWTRTGNFSELERVAQEAWVLGHKAWDEAVNYSNYEESGSAADPDLEKVEPCPTSVGLSKGAETGKDGERVVLLPCGLAVGSSITVIGINLDALLRNYVKLEVMH